MKSFGIFAASALFGAIANAVPLNKRDIVWVTETAVDIVTIPVTKTVWAGSEETTVVATSASTSSHVRHQFRHSRSKKSSRTSTSVYVAPTANSSSTSSSVYVAPTTSSTSVYVAPTTSSTSVYVAPTTSSTSVYVAPTTTSSSEYVAPTTSSSSSVYVAPTTSSVYVAPTTSSVYVAPTISSTSVYVAPTTSTTSSAPAATTSASSGGSVSSGMAASGTEYSGDLTWYDVGLGACGWNNVDGDKIVAISHVIFDSYSTGNPNTNPLCGKYVTITGKDGSAYEAKVVDRCLGCVEGDLDLSHQFFNTVTANGDGRVSGMEWSWN